MSVARRTAPVVALRKEGAYFCVTIEAPEIARGAEAGQFLAVAVGADDLILRRFFSIHDRKVGGRDSGCVTFVLAVRNKGTAWLAGRRPGEVIDVVGPLGRPFPLPQREEACVLVGGGYGGAPLQLLARTLIERRCEVHLVLGAANRYKLFRPSGIEERVNSVTITTDDGSHGVRGRVSDVLPRVIDEVRAVRLYGCGPLPMLRAVAEVVDRTGIVGYVAAEAMMACGIGVCMTCVLPVVDDDGITRMTRACVDGPIFRTDRVRWNEIGTIPADCFGASSPREG
jgi:dihydroorotate dehydrogenase electron transfer subunit